MEVKSIDRTLGDFDAHLQLQNGVFSIVLNSNQDLFSLEATFSNQSMPQKLNKILSSEQLFTIMTNISDQNVRITEGSELILILDIFGIQKQFPLKLNKKILESKQLIKENKQLRKEIALLKNQLIKVNQSDALIQMQTQLKEEKVKREQIEKECMCVHARLDQAEQQLHHFEEQIHYLNKEIQKQNQLRIQAQEKARKLEMKIADGTGTSLNNQSKLFPSNNIFGSNTFTPKIEPLSQNISKNNSGVNLFQNNNVNVPQPPKLTTKPPPLTDPFFQQLQPPPSPPPSSIPCWGNQKSKKIQHLFDSEDDF